jgi:general transcriptional corepressor CYC8
MDPQLWYGIGILYEKFESYEHAISSLMAVLKMSPNFYQKSEVLSRLGYIFARTNDIPNSIVYFQNSILTNTFTIKKKIEIMIKIGILYEEKNELTNAQQSYENALALDNDNYVIYQHLAWNMYLQGNHPQAMEY